MSLANERLAVVLHSITVAPSKLTLVHRTVNQPARSVQRGKNKVHQISQAAGWCILFHNHFSFSSARWLLRVSSGGCVSSAQPAASVLVFSFLSFFFPELETNEPKTTDCKGKEEEEEEKREMYHYIPWWYISWIIHFSLSYGCAVVWRVASTTTSGNGFFFFFSLTMSMGCLKKTRLLMVHGRVFLLFASFSLPNSFVLEFYWKWNPRQERKM